MLCKFYCRLCGSEFSLDFSPRKLCSCSLPLNSVIKSPIGDILRFITFLFCNIFLDKTAVNIILIIISTDMSDTAA